jgi:hypothetical protein
MLLILPAFAMGIAQMLLTLLVVLIVLSLVYWLINTLAPEPVRKYAIAVVVVLAVIVLLYFLMGQGGELKM